MDNNNNNIIKKRGRGRPRKIKKESQNIEKIKRQRGRPRKYTTDEERLKAIKKSKLKYKYKNIEKLREKDRIYRRNKRNHKIT